MLTIQEIYKRLPHRYPFLMVDRILSIEEGKTVVGLKNVTVNEPYFQGHFPDEPIMPGVMIIETMAQIGGFVFDIVNERGYVIGVDKTKFKKVVIPGDTLIVEAILMQKFGSMGKVKAVAKVDNVEVASGEITYNFKPING
ncbi:MAG: 3-hydroxyacyl-ACP dehydratase FabZ [Lutisporaceae bacterium]